MTTTNPTNQNSGMKRDDYKAIKRMNKAELTAYLSRVYMRGYEAGLKAAAPTYAGKITTDENA